MRWVWWVWIGHGKLYRSCDYTLQACWGLLLKETGDNGTFQPKF